MRFEFEVRSVLPHNWFGPSFPVSRKCETEAEKDLWLDMFVQRGDTNVEVFRRSVGEWEKVDGVTTEGPSVA